VLPLWLQNLLLDARKVWPSCATIPAEDSFETVGCAVRTSKLAHSSQHRPKLFGDDISGDSHKDVVLSANMDGNERGLCTAFVESLRSQHLHDQPQELAASQCRGEAHFEQVSIGGLFSSAAGDSARFCEAQTIRMSEIEPPVPPSVTMLIRASALRYSRRAHAAVGCSWPRGEFPAPTPLQQWQAALLPFPSDARAGIHQFEALPQVALQSPTVTSSSFASPAAPKLASQPLEARCPTLKIADFGLARAFSPSCSRVQFTHEVSSNHGDRWRHICTSSVYPLRRSARVQAHTRAHTRTHN
jgi:hypothetical protein